MALTKRKRRISDDLSAMIRAKFRLAEEANAEHQIRAMDCLRQMDGTLFALEEDEEEAAGISMNITRPLVMALHAMLSDIVKPTTGQPFTLEPSPTAELPEETRIELQGALEQNFPQLMEMTGGDPNAMRNVVQVMVRTATAYYQEEAEEAAVRMTHAVNGKLQASGFEDAFDAFLQDIVTYPLAILQGPIAQIEKVRAWQNGRLSFSDQLVRKVKRVSCFDFYPAGGAKDTDTCPYVCVRERFTASSLLDVAGGDGYDVEAIDEIIQMHDSYILPYPFSGPSEDPEAEAAGAGELATHGLYDAIGYFGRIRGEDLVEFGVDVSDERRFYEAEVWVIGQYVFKAVLNPDPLGRRGFYTEAYQREPGALWGKSPVEMIRDAQQQCTASGRALVRNMSFASGPMGEVETARVLGEDDPTELYPLMVKPVKAAINGAAGQVYRFHQVPSLAGELMGVFDRFYALAFELLGVPRLAFGTIEGQSTLGRTSGGVAMMLNQASKPVKRMLRRVEHNVIERLIQRFVDYEMMFSDDITLKGDVHVRARGVSGLVEQERQEGRLEWALQSLAPFAGLVPPEYIMRLIVAMLEQAGVPTKGLPNFSIEDAVSQDLASAGALGGGGPDGPGEMDPSGFLDGRSEVAQQAIAASNEPGVA